MDVEWHKRRYCDGDASCRHGRRLRARRRVGPVHVDVDLDRLAAVSLEQRSGRLLYAASTDRRRRVWHDACDERVRWRRSGAVRRAARRQHSIRVLHCSGVGLAEAGLLSAVARRRRRRAIGRDNDDNKREQCRRNCSRRCGFSAGVERLMIYSISLFEEMKLDDEQTTSVRLD